MRLIVHGFESIDAPCQVVAVRKLSVLMCDVERMAVWVLNHLIDGVSVYVLHIIRNSIEWEKRRSKTGTV